MAELAGLSNSSCKGTRQIKGLGEVFGSRFAFQVSELRAPEPDVAFVCSDRLHLVEETKMVGAPDIAVEIVSRESRQRDYFDKKRLYEEAATPEYWIIDPLQRRAEFYRLREGRYVLVSLENNRIFRSEVLRGFWLDVEWLFMEPLPSAYEKLHEILGAAQR